MLFWPSVIHSADFLQQFSFPSGFVDPVAVSLLVLVLTLNGHSRDFVIPRLLTPHPHLEWPDSGSVALQEEVQQVGAAGRHVEVHVEVLAHAIWTFLSSGAISLLS